jgi:uncharacterized membrane protein YqjE
MYNLLPILAQAGLGMLLNPGKPNALGLRRLLMGLLGMVAAAFLGCVAFVILTFVGVAWLMPPGTGPLEISLITALFLLIAALGVWWVARHGESPQEFLEDVLAPEPTPLRHLGHSAQNLVEAFTRGWHTPPSPPAS